MLPCSIQKQAFSSRGRNGGCEVCSKRLNQLKLGTFFAKRGWCIRSQWGRSLGNPSRTQKQSRSQQLALRSCPHSLKQDRSPDELISWETAMVLPVNKLETFSHDSSCSNDNPFLPAKHNKEGATLSVHNLICVSPGTYIGWFSVIISALICLCSTILWSRGLLLKSTLTCITSPHYSFRQQLESNKVSSTTITKAS